jgi:hypothetical protein
VVGAVVLAAAIYGAFKPEQLDLSQTNPTPEGKPDPVPLSQRIQRFRTGPLPKAPGSGVGAEAVPQEEHSGSVR